MEGHVQNHLCKPCNNFSFTIHVHVYVYIYIYTCRYVFWIIIRPIHLLSLGVSPWVEDVEQWTILFRGHYEVPTFVWDPLGIWLFDPQWRMHHRKFTILECTTESGSGKQIYYRNHIGCLYTHVYIIYSTYTHVTFNALKLNANQFEQQKTPNVTKVLDRFSNFQHMVRVRMLFNQSLVACWLVV